MAEPDSTAGMSGEEQENRFREIVSILMKNQVMRGMTPEKLVNVLTDLGPTYIKLGQILSLHSDILPQEYCDALRRLNSDADPMPYSEVRELVSEAYGGEKPEEIFREFDEKPLGSASIAQAHRAVLKSGEEVVVKVQRRNIYRRMEADISLMRRALRKLPAVGGLKNLVSFSDVLDELWAVAREEMDFQQEADNMDELARNNSDVVFIKVPKVYREYLTEHVLVMEYIDGYSIGDVENLRKAGYDMDEIGRKYADNFVRQVIRDGFFHADPHTGNVRIQGGKIVWLDMGMMGRLSDTDRRTCMEAVLAIADHDTERLMNAVLSIVELTGRPDRDVLYRDLDDIIHNYGYTDLKRFRIGSFLRDVLEVMKKNHLRFPQGVSMLVRGLTQAEGVLSQISPEISIMEIAMQEAEEYYRQNFSMKAELQETGKKFLSGAKKATDIPELTSEAIRQFVRGRSRADVSLRADAGLRVLMRSLTGRISAAVWGAGLIIGSAILAASGDGWRTALAAAGFVLSGILGAAVLYRGHREKEI